MIDLVLEDAWADLLNHYKKGRAFLNEEDMRCLTYHLCTSRLNAPNCVHAQKRIGTDTQRKYDLVLTNPITKCRTAVELKCWLWKSSGLSESPDDTIENQLHLLIDAVEPKKYDIAYLLVLDEFGNLDGRLMNFQPKEENLHFKYFMPTCGKTENKWKFDEKARGCSNCPIQIQCQSSQNDLHKEWVLEYMQR